MVAKINHDQYAGYRTRHGPSLPEVLTTEYENDGGGPRLLSLLGKSNQVAPSFLPRISGILPWGELLRPGLHAKFLTSSVNSRYDMPAGDHLGCTVRRHF